MTSKCIKLLTIVIVMCRIASEFKMSLHIHWRLGALVEKHGSRPHTIIFFRAWYKRKLDRAYFANPGRQLATCCRGEHKKYGYRNNITQRTGLNLRGAVQRSGKNARQEQVRRQAIQAIQAIQVIKIVLQVCDEGAKPVHSPHRSMLFQRADFLLFERLQLLSSRQLTIRVAVQ